MSTTMECPHCATELKYGVNYCTGCRAEIKYKKSSTPYAITAGLGLVIALGGFSDGEIGGALVGVVMVVVGVYFFRKKSGELAIPNYTRQRNQ